MDKGLANVSSMMAIAGRLKNVDLSKVAFVTVPWTQYAPDPGRGAAAQPAAGQLFAAVRSDADLTGGDGAPQAGSAAGSAPAQQPQPRPPPASASAAPAYNKAIQPITVTNATGAPGRSQELIDALAAAGVHGQLRRTSPRPRSRTTQILYGSGFADVASDVATLFGIPAKPHESHRGISGVRLQVGQDFASGVKYGQTGAAAGHRSPDGPAAHQVPVRQ